MVRWLASERAWAVRCLAINAGGSAIDYALLLSLALWLNAPTPVAGLVGLAAGGAFSFTLNRKYTFRGCSLSLASQALRYVAVMGVLMAIHAVVLSFLRDRAGVPLMFAKLMADMGVMGVSAPFALKRWVFPVDRTPVQTAPAGRPGLQPSPA